MVIDCTDCAIKPTCQSGGFSFWGRKQKHKQNQIKKDKTKRDKTKQIKQNKLQGSKNAKDEDKIQDNGTEAAVDRAACVSCWVIVVGIR